MDEMQVRWVIVNVLRSVSRRISGLKEKFSYVVPSVGYYPRQEFFLLCMATVSL